MVLAGRDGVIHVWPDGVDLTRQYNIGSVAKLLTALAILQLDDQGVLSIEDELAAHLDRRIEPAGRGELIRLVHLLTHTSGLRPCAHDEPQTVCAIMPPGIHLDYQNANFSLLGEVVASASGRAFDNYLEQELLLPLGLENTRVDRGLNTGLSVGAGSVLSTPGDLGRLAAVLLDEQDASLSAPLRTRFLGGHLPIVGGLTAHFAWSATRDAGGATCELSHSGTDEDAGAEFILFPQQDVALIVLTRSRYSPEFMNGVHALVQRHLGLPSCDEPAVAAPALREGIYRSGPHTLEIVRDGDRLHLVASDSERFALAEMTSGRYAAFDPSLDERLAAPLSYAEGRMVEVIGRGETARGLVWNDRYYELLARD